MSQRSELPPPPAHVHFVGIGGIGMSGLARILNSWGYRITGSDAFPSDLIDSLGQEGIDVRLGHEDTQLATAADLMVTTAAVRDTNAEIHAAKAAGKPVIKRAELLGMLANERTCIAVAGSHGKSTTSGMLVTALRKTGLDPSYAVGAVVASTGTNAEPGTSAEMVVEADEYDYSFLWLKPTFAIITNIDYDHPDLFPDQGTYDRAFVRFARGAKSGGVLVANGDDAGVRRVIDDLRSSPAELVTFGWDETCDWRIQGTNVIRPGGDSIRLDLAVPGRHNIGNAAAALIVMYRMGIDLPTAANALGTFAGVSRRFELRGEVNEIAVIDDYAHHPEEITATIAAARSRYPGRRIVAAFQPHTYSRTKAMVDQFATSLRSADYAVVLDIYPARETDTLGVSSDEIVRRMPSDQAELGGKPSDAVAVLAKCVHSGDIVLTMGAGDITLVGPKLLALLQDSGS